MRKIIGEPVMKWKRMSEPRVFKRGFGGIALGSQRFKNPRTGKQREFTLIMKPDGVTVFAMTADGEVILVSQFKQAVDKIVFEAPGGQLAHRGEDVEIAARRELRQETGFVPGVLVNTGPIKDWFWTSPRSSQRMSHTFLAIGCTMAGTQRQQEKGLVQRIDPGEEAIGVYGCAPMEFWELVERGVIRSLETVVAAYRAADLGAIPHRPPPPT